MFDARELTSPEPEPTVFVVDDDEAVRESLRWLVRSVGLAVQAFATAEDFLEAVTPDRPGCLVLDVRMPGMSGLELQQQLATRGVPLPIIMLTGYGDVPTAVRALTRGALDFIEKPFSRQLLLDRIRHAVVIDANARRLEADRAEVASRAATLTPREREVLRMVVGGSTNKLMAANLGICEKTIEVHRAHVMRKMRAGSLPELVRLAALLDPPAGGR
jgi:two-component system, LuxR family, response regulator FixJ